MEEHLKKIFENYPEFLSSEDLVTLGIYRTIDATYQARIRKTGLPYVKLNKKILYPKNALIEWLITKSINAPKNKSANKSVLKLKIPTF